MNVAESTMIDLPFGPPPILPDVKAELRGYIECPEKLPIHQVENVQRFWTKESNYLSILNYDLAPLGTALKFDRDPITGCIGQMQEVPIPSAGETARNSMSMTRAPGPLAESVRGNTSNFPFWPGGFDEPKVTQNTSTISIDFENNLRTLAKGFRSGIEFENDNFTPKDAGRKKSKLSNSRNQEKDEPKKKPEIINLMEAIHLEETSLGFWSDKQSGVDEQGVNLEDSTIATQIDDITVISESSLPVLCITEEKDVLVKTEWAEEISVKNPVTDFEKKIPDPAMTFKYELDIFQKQAILKLEEGGNVFVAAHTSAGKTTVAEYAIAMSQKHMTRVIYTSPIKALSNQKYRDFKTKFENVGLITGDLQINQTASCLIMTTEILQSMLYCASEVLRDLEFVIFDEVHYITNEDRGHVWEEIVILLPQTVTIVMLSATVPDPVTFASWVGQIKRRKVYVITTKERPVPLQHYLYTGVDVQTMNNIYEIFDVNGFMHYENWKEAQASKKLMQIQKDAKKGRGGKHQGDSDTKRDKNPTPFKEKDLWKGFLKYLKEEKKLPVVVFTLSRKRCDQNGDMMGNVADLTDGAEKKRIKRFFSHYIQLLKGPDRNLPQVLRMQKLLLKGIGIHHSGILPILKEFVEMLFQHGLVKLLFATETFAMGVNMPTRTVVFDSIRKYDGDSFRNLTATEYIQMAGRAGRRGHDKIGTVIVLCKTAVPQYTDIANMMCGKSQSLESKFKVTYKMILNLRRFSESVSVENMMRRSFMEARAFKKASSNEVALKEITKKLEKLPPLTDQQHRLLQFYRNAEAYLNERALLRVHYFATSASRLLRRGRFILVSYKQHYCKLGLILQIGQENKILVFKVLVLTNAGDSDRQVESKPDIWYKLNAIVKDREIFVPDGCASHCVLSLTAEDMIDITEWELKVDCKMIYDDWEKRQQPRFRNDPPGQTCQRAMQELLSRSLNIAAMPSIIDSWMYLNSYKGDCSVRLGLVYNVGNMEKDFNVVHDIVTLEKRKEELQHSLSNEGLTFYSTYTNMVTILKHLGYIEEDERVALKGKVALQMGRQELFITELILKNVLTNLEPAEIAAVLSAVVFQQRTKESEQNITPTLDKTCKVMQEIWDELQKLEIAFGVQSLEPLNFGLVQVVYEWAQAKSFAEIMTLTDVQEGIIVRCIQQLNETLRDVKNAAVTIAETVLKEKMEEASTAIKRDIVFAASLYTQD